MNVSGLNNYNFGANYSAIVKNQFGLHFMPSATIAKVTSSVDKPIFFSTKNLPERNVKGSLISIMGLEPTCGKEISIRVDDDYPKDILQTVLDCIGASTDNEVIQILKKVKQKINIVI